jgi:hypothetical protein
MRRIEQILKSTLKQFRLLEGGGRAFLRRVYINIESYKMLTFIKLPSEIKILQAKLLVNLLFFFWNDRKFIALVDFCLGVVSAVA